MTVCPGAKGQLNWLQNAEKENGALKIFTYGWYLPLKVSKKWTGGRGKAPDNPEAGPEALPEVQSTAGLPGISMGKSHLN